MSPLSEGLIFALRDLLIIVAFASRESLLEI